MECCMRPNRSDVHLSNEEEAKIEEATREYFDGIAPKRHTKPQRSEYTKTYTDVPSCCIDVIPEHVHFQILENGPQKLVYTNGSKVVEEFVETKYYKDLNRIDEQHHMTGSGFIAIENMKGKLFSLEPDFATAYHGSCNGNPATNEWIPSADDEVATIPEEGYGKPPLSVSSLTSPTGATTEGEDGRTFHKHIALLAIAGDISHNLLLLYFQRNK